MREYEYNVFLEDVMLYTFNDYFDMTDFYDRETYELLYALLESYYNRIIVTKLTNKRMTDTDVYKSVHSLELLVACNTRIDKVTFMLLCDCINEINEQYNIDVRIDFDEYYDTDNACIFFYEYSTATVSRNEFSFYDYQYCKIRLDAYIRQYQRDEQIYYHDRYECDTH